MPLQPLTDPDATLAPAAATLPPLIDPDTSNNPIVPEGQDWTTAGGKIVGGQQEPSFMKKLDMINTGVDRGVKYFTLGLMSKLPFGDRWQKAIKRVDAESTAEQEYNKKTYGDLYPNIGEVGGETLATLPVGGALGLTGKAATLVGKAAPTGLKTLGKYGTSAAGGAGVLAGTESQRYDPENPGQLINTKAAGETLSNPLAYALPALGTKLSTWAKASKDLGAAKEVFPNIMARNLKEPGATTTLSNMFFGIPSALTGMGKQAKQVNMIGDDISAFIRKVAGTKEAQTADNLTEYSANIVQSTLKKMDRAENKIWDQGFKSTALKNPQDVKDEVINAIDLLKGSAIGGESTTINYLKKGIQKGDLNVEDVKKLNTLISGASINARNLEGGVGNQLAEGLSQIKDNLLNHIQNSLSPEQMKNFSAARAFSANKFELFKSAPLLQRAIHDDTSAHKLVNTLTSEAGVLPPKRAAVGILSEGGKDMLAATKLQQALESSDIAGHINLNSFLKKTSDYSQTKEIMNEKAYGALQGLNKYLKNINDSSKLGMGKMAVVGGGLASAAGAGALGAGATGLMAPLVAYGAATFIANHSPLKTLLNALTKNLPSSTYDAVVRNIEKHLTRAGYFMSEDGILKSKDSKEIPPLQEPQQ